MKFESPYQMDERGDLIREYSPPALSQHQHISDLEVPPAWNASSLNAHAFQ